MSITGTDTIADYYDDAEESLGFNLEIRDNTRKSTHISEVPADDSGSSVFELADQMRDTPFSDSEITLDYDMPLAIPGKRAKSANSATAFPVAPSRCGTQFDSSDTAIGDADMVLGDRPIRSVFPDVSVIPGSEVHLTDRVRLTLNHLIQAVRSESARAYVTVREARIETFRSYEEDVTNIILYLKVDLPAEIALDYWERLGRRIPYWSLNLDHVCRKILSERIILQVDWD